MKKVIIIILVVFLILAIILGTIGFLVFRFLNKEKDSITANEFKKAFEEKDFIVVDVAEQFAEFSHIKKVYLAIEKDNNYQIEFYQISDEESAIEFYNNNKSIFESYKGNTSTETNLAISNYAKYTLSANGQYMVVSRIDNTVIYVDVDSSYKDEVQDLLENIGY